MTDLQERINGLLDAVARARQTHIELGLSGSPMIALRLWRRCNGKTARLAKGVEGRVLQHGDGKRHPSIVQVDAGAFERYLNRVLWRERFTGVEIDAPAE